MKQVKKQLFLNKPNESLSLYCRRFMDDTTMANLRTFQSQRAMHFFHIKRCILERVLEISNEKRKTAI